MFARALGSVCVCVFLSLLQLLQYDGVSINSVPVERKPVCTHKTLAAGLPCAYAVA